MKWRAFQSKKDKSKAQGSDGGAAVLLQPCDHAHLFLRSPERASSSDLLPGTPLSPSHPLPATGVNMHCLCASLFHPRQRVLPLGLSGYRWCLFRLIPLYPWHLAGHLGHRNVHCPGLSWWRAVLRACVCRERQVLLPPCGCCRAATGQPPARGVECPAQRAQNAEVEKSWFNH